jgi:ABC-type polar amino acid transport system ATPase subunit
MIELKNVSKWYGPVQVLNECSATISKGEVVVVCGPSGSGKSTLIKTINALEPFQKGEITVDGMQAARPQDQPAQAAQPRGHGVPAFRAVPAPVGDGQPDDCADQGAGPQRPTMPRSAA